MLEVFVKYLCFVMMSLAGVIIINNITNSKNRILKIENIIIILCFLFIPTYLYNPNYNLLNTIEVFCTNILIYKCIFKKNISEIIILTCEVMIISFVADLINALIFSSIADLSWIRENWYTMLSANIIASVTMVIISIPNQITKILRKINDLINNSEYATNILFLILFIIVLCVIDKSIYLKLIKSNNVISEIIIIIIFFILLYVYIREKNSYDKLSKQYDGMLTYVNEFEDWIEKEQFNRHEYKNQLAVLRCLTKEKNVKDKIDEILEDNINIEGNIVHELKVLPKGGIKGLMYYKSSIAQKKKINLTINVSLDYKTYLNKLSKEEIRTLCKLIGVYYDNAIEAAAETRKKVILVEIYELKDKISFVFSNTFKKHSNFNNRNQKGISSKGEGRGNGLYFANKLLEKNGWIESKQEIIDNYYIQQISINKKASK